MGALTCKECGSIEYNHCHSPNETITCRKCLSQGQIQKLLWRPWEQVRLLENWWGDGPIPDITWGDEEWATWANTIHFEDALINLRKFQTRLAGM